MSRDSLHSLISLNNTKWETCWFPFNIHNIKRFNNFNFPNQIKNKKRQILQKTQSLVSNDSTEKILSYNETKPSSNKQWTKVIHSLKQNMHSLHKSSLKISWYNKQSKITNYLNYTQIPISGLQINKSSSCCNNKSKSYSTSTIPTTCKLTSLNITRENVNTVEKKKYSSVKNFLFNRNENNNNEKDKLQKSNLYRKLENMEKKKKLSDKMNNSRHIIEKYADNVRTQSQRWHSFIDFNINNIYPKKKIKREKEKKKKNENETEIGDFIQKLNPMYKNKSEFTFYQNPKNKSMTWIKTGHANWLNIVDQYNKYEDSVYYERRKDFSQRYSDAQRFADISVSKNNSQLNLKRVEVRNAFTKRQEMVVKLGNRLDYIKARIKRIVQEHHNKPKK